MRLWLVRGVLAIALIAALGLRMNSVQAEKAPAPEYNASLATEALLRSYGATVLPHLLRADGSQRRVVRFELAGCAEPIVVYPFGITTDALSELESGGFTGRTTRIAYFDESWATQDRNTLLLSWVEQRLRFAFGDRTFLPTRTALVIAAMPDCQSHLELDWSPVWQPHAA